MTLAMLAETEDMDRVTRTVDKLIDTLSRSEAD